MATNKCPHLLLAIIFFSGCAPLLWAQSAGYFVDTESGETHFRQRLVWAGGEYAMRYEVVIEREIDETYITHLQEFTELPFVEVSLPPGHYRYQVISYDILDRPEEETQWINLEVRLAVQPKLYDIVSKFVPADDDRPAGFMLYISGQDLASGAEFILRKSDGMEIIPEVLASGEDGEAIIFVNSENFIFGKYEIVIRNPGRLEAVMGGITLSAPRPEPKEREKMFNPLELLLLFSGVAWAPVIPLHGDFFGNSFSPLGAGAHIGAAYPIPRDIHVGAELTALWHIQADNDDYRNILSAGFNLLTMKWLPNQIMALGFRMGLSFIFLPVTQEKLTYNIGASYLWRFTDKFLLETGFDYAGRIKENSFDGCIRPWIGAGVMF